MSAPLPVIEVHTQVGSLLAHRDDEVITANLIRWGVWEARETQFLRTLLRPGDTFVDVGANIGYFSVLAAGCIGSSGYVIAFEPEPRNLELLHMNLTRHGVQANATVFPLAAYSHPCRMALATNEANRGDHVLAPQATTGLEVRCVRLDDVLPRSVDVIKIDTQGFDHDVIAGLSQTIAANPALVVLTELSLTKLDERGVDVDEVVAGYLARGFGLEALDAWGTPFPLAAADVVPHCVAAAPEEVSLVLRRTR
jgi:FkbM family methyltransferase